MNMPTDHRSPITPHGVEINILHYWNVIMRSWKMIVGILVAASILAVVVSLTLPKSYRAEAVLIPVTSRAGGGGLGALASQVGGIASLAGVSLSGAGTGDLEKFMAILKSRTLTENVINRENLMQVLFEKQWDEKNQKWKTTDPDKAPNMEKAVKIMKSAVVSRDDKKAKTIKITGTFKAPELAARIVNAYVDELQKFITVNAFTTAKRNRIFIEGQLAENKEQLLEAGKEINEFYRTNQVSSAEAKVDVPIVRDTSPMNGLPVADHEPVADASAVIQSLVTQKADIDQRIAEARTVKNVPQQVYLSYLMLRRELLAKVNALLTTQYEMAKIEESKDDLAFQVIDNAVPPVRRYFPKRAQICMMSFMAALFGAIFLAFFREYLERMKKLHRDAATA